MGTFNHKSYRHMKIQTVNVLVNALDTVMQKHYNNPIPRDHYISIVHTIARKLTVPNSNGVEINNNKERLKWGRVKHNGKLIWKLDIVLKNLIEEGVLSRTGYLNMPFAGKCRTYTLSEGFLNALNFKDAHIAIEYINDKLPFIVKEYNERISYHQQYSLLMSDRFSIDETKVFKWLEEATNSYGEVILDEDESILLVESLDGISKENALRYSFNTIDLLNKNVFVSMAGNGRVYTTFNTLKRELRKCCTIDNEELLSIDLKCSQPYILASYLHRKYKNETTKEFYDLVTNNDIYLWAVEHTSLDCRDNAKLDVCKWIMSRDARTTSLTANYLKKHWKKLYDLVLDEKSILIEQGSNMANFLQHIEANIFMSVAEQLNVLSVHDSLYFPKKDKGKVEKAIKEKLKSEGFKRFRLSIE